MRWMVVLLLATNIGVNFSVGTEVTEAANPPHTDRQPEMEIGDVPWVGWLELSGVLPDGPVPYAWMSGSQGMASLRGVVQSLEKVASDDRYLGVVIHLDEVNLGLAQINEISRSIKKVRAAGRKVLIFAQHYDLLSYTLACSADKILLQHKGLVELTGVNIEELYVVNLLEKIGLKADLLQIGQFKGAQEPFTRSGPSQAWNETMDGLLDDIYAIVLDQIAKGRQFGPQGIEEILRKSWLMTDANYIQHGVVDYLTDRDLKEVTAVEFGNEFDWKDLFEASSVGQTIENPFALLQMLFKEPTVRIHRPSLAVIHAAGPITSGDSQSDSSFGGETIGSRELVRVLGEAQSNSHIKGVLLRLDSPGGSALASEVIWQAVRQLVQTKPVFISIGSMAASGGYYIACAGDRIYASRGSMIGSIGVVGGKITLGGLYEKLGVGVHRRSRGPLGDMFNSVEPFTNQQRAVIEKAFHRTYDQFTNRVATGRGNRIADIDSVAHGRLFTGRMAVKNGLIDKLGGLHEALEDLGREVHLEPGTYDIINLPPPQSLSEFFEQWFQFGSVHVVEPDVMAVGVVRAAMGPRAWRAAQQVLSGLVLLKRESTLVLLPMGLVIR